MLNALLVEEIPEDFIFVSDSQEVQSIKEYCGIDHDLYDSFFVQVGEGDYTAVYGMRGIVPYIWKFVTLVYPNPKENDHALYHKSR